MTIAVDLGRKATKQNSVKNYILNRDGRVLASPASLRFVHKEISDQPYRAVVEKVTDINSFY